jgi:hypothetical protein
MSRHRCHGIMPPLNYKRVPTYRTGMYIWHGPQSFPAMDVAVAVVGVPTISSAVWDDYRMRRVGGISSSVVTSSSSSLSRECAVATHQHSWLVLFQELILCIYKAEGQHTSSFIDRTVRLSFVNWYDR